MSKTKQRGQLRQFNKQDFIQSTKSVLFKSQQIGGATKRGKEEKFITGGPHLGTPRSVGWNIQHRVAPYQPGQRFCGLCLSETTVIAFDDPAVSLNKRSEIRGWCRHRSKYKLCNYHRPPSYVPPAAVAHIPQLILQNQ